MPRQMQPGDQRAVLISPNRQFLIPLAYLLALLGVVAYGAQAWTKINDATLANSQNIEVVKQDVQEIRVEQKAQGVEQQRQAILLERIDGRLSSGRGVP